MAEFSIEWANKNPEESIDGDFSIIELFKKLKPNESIMQICEGFGNLYIANIKGECNLGFRILKIDKNNVGFYWKPLTEL